MNKLSSCFTGCFCPPQRVHSEKSQNSVTQNSVTRKPTPPIHNIAQHNIAQLNIAQLNIPRPNSPLDMRTLSEEKNDSTTTLAQSPTDHASSATYAVAPSKKFMLKNARLLIVDDLPNIEMIKKIAIERGFLPENIVPCTNPAEATAAFPQAAKDGQPFNVVFLGRCMRKPTDIATLAQNSLDAGLNTRFIMISDSPPDTLPAGINLHKEISNYFATL